MLIMLIGPSGSGKTHCEKMLQSHGFSCVRSTTSRQRRPNESDEDYEFVSPSLFENYIADNLLIEYTLFHGAYYGIKKTTIDPSINQVVTLEPEGAAQLKLYCEAHSITFMLVWFEVSMKIRSHLMLQQGRTEEETQKRMNDGVLERFHESGLTPNLRLNSPGDYETILEHLRAS